MQREFGASSERLRGAQLTLDPVFDQLTPEEQDSITALQQVREGAEAHLDDMTNQAAVDGHAADTTVDADTQQAESQSEPDSAAASAGTEKKRTRPPGTGGRKPLPEDLPCEQLSYLPPADHPFLVNTIAAKELSRRIIRRLTIVPLQVMAQDIDCPRMRLTFPGGITTTQTIAPPAILGTGQADDSVLIHSACDKVLDHLPTYRQSQRFERIGYPIARSKLCRWHQALARFVSPIAEAIFNEIIAESVIGIDDTVHRLVDAELHRCKQGRLWAVTGASDSYYFFSETREGAWINNLLGGYTGGVMGDAYAGHNVLLSSRHITALYCWAHVRRKFFEATDEKRRTQALHLIGKLYELERALSDHPPDQKVTQRRTKAQPILASFKQLLEAWDADPAVLPKSSLGLATTYALNQWDGLITSVTIGDAPIDNNRTERALRRNALHRKNSLFSASIKGAEAYATLSTVIQSACQHDLNPVAYLTAVIEDLHFGRHPVAALTPAQFKLRNETKKPVKDRS